MTLLPATDDTPDSTRARILAATLRCIERKGPAAVTMEDVAAESGFVRKTVYLAFGNRAALMDAVLKQMIGKNVTRLRRYARGFDSFDEALVKGCVRHVRLIREDKVMFSLIENAHSSGLERYTLGPASPVATMMLTVWQDVFAAARARGELRADLSDTEIGDWLRGVVTLLLIRDDLTATAQAALLKKFVLPALKPGAA